MSTTTTSNYGWTIPNNDELVKDGAAAIRTLGNAADTSLKTVSDGRGLVHINTTSFSAVSSQSINDVFSATYENYFIIVTLTAASANNAMNMRLRVSGSDDTGSNYNGGGFICRTTGSTVTGQDQNNGTAFELGGMSSSSSQNAYVIELLKPFLAEKSNFRVSASGADGTSGYGRYTANWHNATTSYTGFTVYPSTGTITGKISTYGRKF